MFRAVLPKWGVRITDQVKTINKSREIKIPALSLNVHTALPPGGSGWIISVGDHADNSFDALGSSDPREVRLEL